jgi:hypothetical protein
MMMFKIGDRVIGLEGTSDNNQIGIIHDIDYEYDRVLINWERNPIILAWWVSSNSIQLYSHYMRGKNLDSLLDDE